MIHKGQRQKASLNEMKDMEANESPEEHSSLLKK